MRPCTCQGPRCQVCRIFEQGGTLAEEFKAGAPWGYDDKGGPVAVLYDLRACSCPRCDTCRNAPRSPDGSMTTFDTPPECEWLCAVSL